ALDRLAAIGDVLNTMHRNPPLHALAESRLSTCDSHSGGAIRYNTYLSNHNAIVSQLSFQESRQPQQIAFPMRRTGEKQAARHGLGQTHRKRTGRQPAKRAERAEDG